MDIKALSITQDISIKAAIKQLDKGAKKILLVVEDEKLIGTITDGDVRRWILKNGSLEVAASEIMNHNPIYVLEEEQDLALDIMKQRKVEAIPILNEKKNIVDIIFWHEELRHRENQIEKLDIPVVIMAGGKGTRLYPYTQIIPKPLIPIEGTSIIERIIHKFRAFSCDNFYVTVNYKKNMIKAYFEELSKDYIINFIEEEKFLGTGGSLYLLKGTITSTFFVSNCDILVEANYADIIKHHKIKKNKITMVTSLKNYTIPYGVIHHDEFGYIAKIEEKPEYSFQVNTGLYVIEPEVIADIPENTFFHITDLIQLYMDKGENVGVYPITDKAWLDMGEFKEMEHMIKSLQL